MNNPDLTKLTKAELIDFIALLVEEVPDIQTKGRYSTKHAVDELTKQLEEEVK